MAGLFAPRAGSRFAVLALLLAGACSGGSSCGGGCAGCPPADYTFPDGDPARPDAVAQDDVLRVRITQDFLDFVRPQLPALLEAQLADLGGGFFVDPDNILHVPLPDQDVFDIGIANAELREAEALIWLDDLDDNLDLRFEAPNLVRLSIANVRVGIDAKIKENFAGITSSCPVLGDQSPRTPGAPPHAAEISISATIDPGIGPRPEYHLDIRSAVEDVAFGDISIDVVPSEIYCSEPECEDCLIEILGTCFDIGGRCGECRIFCGLITNAVLDLATGFLDILGPLLDGLVEPVVGGLLGDAVNSLNGTPAKLEQPLDLAALSGLDPLAGAEPLGVLVAPRPGRFPVIDRGTGDGMEITVDAGAEAELADCVVDPGPLTVTAGPVPLPAATDGTGRPYHLFATFASAYLNQVLYAVHRSGALCLKLSTEDIADLSGGQFTLNASLLSLVAPELGELATDRAPVILELKPKNAAEISLGTGERIGSGPDGGDRVDWLVKLALEDLGIAFHVFIQDRFVRVFEVNADGFVGMNLTVLPDNRLELAVGEIRIDGFTETFNELIPNADFATVLPTLLDLGLGAVLNQAITFDLDLDSAVSDALGGLPLSLRVNEIFRDGPAEDYLTLTLTFVATGSRTRLRGPTVETFAELDPQEPGLVETIDGVRRTTGAVRLRVATAPGALSSDALEYQVRVDEGLWRTAQPAGRDGTLRVQDPKLRVPGPHAVDVRARLAGDYTSLDPTPHRVPVRVDPFPPSLAARLGDEGVEVRVRDAETTDGRTLRLEARPDTESWWAVPLDASADNGGTALAIIPYADLAGAQTVTLRARDASGNHSPARTLSLPRPPEDAPSVDPDPAGCACSASAPPGGPFNWWLPWMIGVFCVAARVARTRRHKS